MNKIPAKQIYLLSIIIIGIIALSVYSTYALFTFESQTSDIVTIHTPTTLNISENIYEYKQLTIEPNSVTTADIDIYNTFEYETCYSVWYKIVGKDIDENKVQLFQKANENIKSSGVLTPLTNIKITIVVINDNDKPIKINLGTIGEQIQEGRCSLNLTEDKRIIKATYDNIEVLNEKVFDNNKEVKEIKENYIIYENEKDIITYQDTDKIYISNKFEYKNELFTLIEPLELTLKELIEENYLETQDVYFCKEKETCTILYKLKELEEINENTGIFDPNIEPKFHYDIKLYDKLIGYLGGKNGLRKINETDYVFYGDNPNNYIYYNCQNNDNVDTCELWRIIGLFYNKETKKYNLKIVNNTSIGKYKYYEPKDEEEKFTWPKTTLYKYLNEEYKFTNNNDIFTHDFKQEIEKYIINEEETNIEKETISSKVNILTLSDFLYASSCEIKELKDIKQECLNNNWLNNIELDQIWTMTQIEKTEKIIEEIPKEEPVEEEQTIEEEQDEVIEEPVEDTPEQPNPPEEEIRPEKKVTNNYIYSVGKEILETNSNELLEVRPTLYLNSSMLLVSGDGSFEKPYVMK